MHVLLASDIDDQKSTLLSLSLSALRLVCSVCLSVCLFGTVIELLALQVSIVEMDGQFDKLEELIYVESHLSNISTKFYGEITQQMLKHADFPGSNNGTGFFQTIVGLKIRELYEKIRAKEAGVLESAKA
jgi:hypothetical protein